MEAQYRAAEQALSVARVTLDSRVRDVVRTAPAVAALLQKHVRAQRCSACAAVSNIGRVEQWRSKEVDQKVPPGAKKGVSRYRPLSKNAPAAFLRSRHPRREAHYPKSALKQIARKPLARYGAM